MTVVIEPISGGSGEQDVAHALRGALTFATAATAHAAGLALLTGPVGTLAPGESRILVFDCAAVTEADSGGLAVLLDWRREALQRGIGLRYRNLPAPLLQLARISGVEALLTAA